MQVSQTADHITHAVIGQQEVVSMGMSDSAALMHILSATLYTFPDLAMVREVICNGWDAHINANKTDVPLKITLKDNIFSVQDFGSGIPHDKIGQIYGTYGDSTKRDDSTTTGGFGLGSKAPFACTDNFEVISCNGGVKTIYRVSKSSMERGGKPSIATIVQLPTEETGITVKVTLDPSMITALRSKVRNVLFFGEILASVNGEEPDAMLPLQDSPNGFVITTIRPLIANHVNLRYGNVVYPIPKHDAYAEQWEFIRREISNNLDGASNFIFMAPPDSISIAPSREALILTDATVKTITELLSMYSKEDVIAGGKTVHQVCCAEGNKIIKEETLEQTSSQVAKAGLGVEFAVRGLLKEKADYAFTMRKAVMNFRMKSIDKVLSEDNARRKRLYKLSKQSGFTGKFAKAVLRVLESKSSVSSRYFKEHRIQSWTTALIGRYIAAPLKIALKDHAMLKYERILFTCAYHGIPDLVTFAKLDMRYIWQVLGYLDRRVLITRSRKAADEWLCANRENSQGFIVYLATSKKGHAEQAEEFFAAQGYKVTVSIPEPVEVPSLPVDPNAVVEPKKPTVKRKGYPTLAASYDGKEFLLTTAREKTPTDGGVVDPVAWVILKSKGEGASTFNRLSEPECKLIVKELGEQIAVVTTPQAEALKVKGVPNVTTLINNFVDEKLVASPDFPRYVAFASQGLEAGSWDIPAKILNKMVIQEDLMKRLGLRFSISPETAMLLTFYASESRHFRDHEVKDRFPKSFALAEKVGKSKKFDELKRKMERSTWWRFINHHELETALSHSSPGSERQEVACELIYQLLK